MIDASRPHQGSASVGERPRYRCGTPGTSGHGAGCVQLSVGYSRAIRSARCGPAPAAAGRRHALVVRCRDVACRDDLADLARRRPSFAAAVSGRVVLLDRPRGVVSSLEEIYGGDMTALRRRHLLVARDADTVRITMNRPGRRNALSGEYLAELLAAFRAGGETDATGIVLGAQGPVFSAGHDFADVAARDLLGVATCSACRSCSPCAPSSCRPSSRCRRW
ncbi:enoyl-CoA hydratase-related protein [Nocardia grenadensis]|uniref:enoyl-CoA hydratase-related protein n=1 Tax=Nocardia grenadensis TaxID=931537 RepID=UPI0035A2340B